MSNRDYASKQLNKIQNRILRATAAAKRDQSSVVLVGASKAQPSQLIRDFHDGGLRTLGENYLQEAIEKQAELADLTIQWHFIGKLQSNKTRAVATHFSWVHGVDRYKIARRLSEHRDSNDNLNLLIQLNVDQEESKVGIPPERAPTLCEQISQLENVSLRGFMVPKARQGFDQQRAPFAIARQTLESINQRYDLKLDTLSMGMSNDLEAAIAEGSTMVRIGTDLFGARR